MTESVTGQLMLFAYTILTGILAGLIYDFYAGVGHLMRLQKKVFTVGDFLFWLVLIAVVYSLLLYYNQGEVRFFVLLGLGVGAGLYYRYLRRSAKGVLWWLLEQTARLLRLAWRLIMLLLAVFFFPFRLFFRVLVFPFKLAGQLTGKIVQLFARPLKKTVPPPVKQFCHRLLARWQRFKSP